MVDNKTVVFKKIPTGLPVPGEHLVVESQPFDLEAVPSGGLIVETLSISLDPYLRFRMRDADIPSYTPAFALNKAADNNTVSRVLRSDSEGYKKGDILIAYLPFAEFVAIPAEQLPKVTKIDNPYGLSPDLFLGPLGMPGLTAYSSLHKIGQPKKGEIIFVSSAAGAVGQVVGQIAKREGLTVIGSVGSDEKLAFILNELGFDGGFNYKKERPLDALKRLAPQGLDIYFENVGGEHLEAAIAQMNNRGRIIVCGMVSIISPFSTTFMHPRTCITSLDISKQSSDLQRWMLTKSSRQIEGYNKPLEERYGVRNLQEIFAKRLAMAGFIVFDDDFGPAYTEEHQRNVQKWIADGSFPAKLHITRGIENTPESLLEIFQGNNFGKAVLKVKD